jgi:hypothetical protein
LFGVGFVEYEPIPGAAGWHDRKYQGAGKEREHFEMSIPENVKQLLEPYRRKTI